MKVKILAVAAIAAGLALADSPVKGTMGQPLLVCGAGRAFLVAPDGRVAWNKSGCGNGNTLVSHLDAVTEYSPDHQVVWQFTCADAPELKLANLCGIWEQKNGNLVVGTYANGVEDGSRTTAFEVTRGKKVVWSYAAAGKRFSMMTAFPVALSQWPVDCPDSP